MTTQEAMRRISYGRMLAFIKDLDDEILDDDQRKFRDEVIRTSEGLTSDAPHIVEVPFEDRTFDLVKCVLEGMDRREGKRCVTMPDLIARLAYNQVLDAFAETVGRRS